MSVSHTVAALPATQHAIQFTGPGELVHNRAKPVHQPGPTQILARVEAVGICFSDTKLLHAFTSHPRKSAVLSGLDAAVLAKIPSYVPGDLPTVPGHEVVCRIVAVGAQVERHRVGERCLVQTDYRHLPTAVANAAFGYNFEGGLQEFVLMDERVIVDPATDERFLIPVGEGPGAASIALLEPWACVEASYAHRERSAPLPEGRLLVVAESGHAVEGLAELIAASHPAAITLWTGDVTQRSTVEDAARSAISGDATGGPATLVFAAEPDDLSPASYDDIIYFGADPARIEALQRLLAPRGVIDVVLGDRKLTRPVAVDVGRIHYDLVRWVGTTGCSAAHGYAMAPADGEVRANERVAVIGAAGPMGAMHVIRAASASVPGVTISAIDIDPQRLAHLEKTVAPIAARHDVRVAYLDSRARQPEPGYSYVALMVPAPPLVAQAIELASDGGRVNVFAGFPIGTRAELDLGILLAMRIYLLGTSGSEIPDMRAVLGRLERGELETNVSVDAVSGMEGVRDALAAVEARTSGGKIVVYPSLHEVGLIPLSDMGQTFPTVAAALDDGRWTRAAEAALLAAAAGRPPQ